MDSTPETKLAGKWTGAGNANVTTLMELLLKTARENDRKDTLADKLIGAARFLDIPDEDIEDALFNSGDSPVFYRP